MTAAIVTLKSLSKSYSRGRPVVDNLELGIKQGSLVTLLGPSGCGKTTTLRMIAGLETPDRGAVMIDGRDVTRLPPEQRDVTMVFQSYALFPHMDVFGNVAYGLKMARCPAGELRGRVAEALELVGLVGFEGRPVDALSGGQQQRVALARALVLKPRVLLFDEPLSNLDAKLRRHVRGEIRALQQRLGLTVVYVTHDQEEALAISDRVVLMHEGRIAQSGAPQDLYHRPDNLFVADFVGRATVVDVAWDGSNACLDGLRLPLESRIAPGQARLILRPEAVRLAAENEPGIAARVTSLAFVGARTEASFETSYGAFEAALSGKDAASLAINMPVRLSFEAASTHLLPGG